MCQSHNHLLNANYLMTMCDKLSKEKKTIFFFFFLYRQSARQQILSSKTILLNWNNKVCLNVSLKSCICMNVCRFYVVRSDNRIRLISLFVFTVCPCHTISYHIWMPVNFFFFWFHFIFPFPYFLSIFFLFSSSLIPIHYL